MIERLLPLVWVISPLLVAPPAVAAQDASLILERAADRYSSLSGFCASFAQTIDVTLLREVKRSRGELCQARPDDFEMRFADPPRDRIVADGNDLWVYFPSTDEGQVFRTPLAQAEGRFDLHREFLSSPGERYASTLEGEERIGDQVMHVLSLEPRVRSPYVHARLWIGAEDYLIRKLEILEESESIRTLELSEIQLNPDLPADWFRFDPPPGVQVITR